ncbi:hypothetical protein Taro_037257 [Colocasia esculenta]|uniref:Uncharacterized protein n=1 Tax=Colocasia esculenta TaxID=4460 RepID=A0A843WCA6_COLES|nr:hypothetical protein [Colocasia esculenta]
MSVCDRIDGRRPRSRRGILRRTRNLRMRPFTDRVEVPIPNWGLAGGFDPRANRYLRPIEGVRLSVYYNALSGAEFQPRNGIPRNQRPIDRLGVSIPNCGHINNSDARAESYAQFFG